MSTKEYPLSVHFEGPGLKMDGLPIGELGEALIAIQRLVYKAHLIQNGGQFVHAAITDEDRQKYALQIAKRKHGSEEIFLNWLHATLNDSVVQAQLSSILTILSGAALTYVKNKVSETLKNLQIGKPNADADELVVRMYPEIQEIVKHIGNPMVEKQPRKKPGDRKKVRHQPKPRVDKIKISIAGIRRPIVFDEKVKDHVRSLENSTKYGEEQTITGSVDKAHILKTKCIEAVIGKEKFWVRMCLTPVEAGSQNTKKAQLQEEKAKRMLRYVLKQLSNRNRKNEFKFTGKPVYRLGRSPGWFNEFEVTKIKAVHTPPKPKKKKAAPAPSPKRKLSRKGIKNVLKKNVKAPAKTKPSGKKVGGK